MDSRPEIKKLAEDHQKLEEVVERLTEEQLTAEAVFDDWTVKDVLAHIAAWNWEEMKAVDVILAGKAPWFDGISEDEFNSGETARRRDWPLKSIIREWKDSFQFLVKRLSSLSEEDWHQLGKLTWSDGTPLTVASLLGYEYEGGGHEGGHARQIAKAFSLT